MSGSSLDGLDLALCSFVSENEFKLLRATSIPYSDAWIDRLQNTSSLSHAALCLLEAEYSQYISKIILDFLQGSKLDYIASHGHTLLHSPEQRYSYQLGQGAYLNGYTAIPVISEFRLQDMAKRGQGAPIAPVVERYLFAGYDSYLNLGGICNISFHQKDLIQAYDIGPCNQILNALAIEAGQAFDKNGALSKSGTVISDLLDKALSHAYYKMSAPKSLDNQFVQREFVDLFRNDTHAVNDRLRTAVELIVTIISNELPADCKSIFATGGGAFNTYLIQQLQDKLSEKKIELVLPDKEIIEFKEAILMALMGYLRIHNKVNVFSSVTGATSDTIAGCVYR